MTARRVPLILLCVLVCTLAAACGSPDGVGDVGPLPTIKIDNNPTCDTGGCRTLEVRAFVSTFRVPQPLWGYKILGEMHDRTGCFTFPASWSFQVIGPTDTIPSAPTDTVTYTWTPDSGAIFIIAVDSALFHDGAYPPSTIRGVTTQFVPGSARGWEATLSGSVDQTDAVQADACP